MADVSKHQEKNHIESSPLVISDTFEGYPLNYFK